MELQEIKAVNRFRGWFSRNWEFVGVFLLFSLYMFLGNFFMWGQAFLDGLANFSGGSDPYFNYIFIQYILAHHQSLLYTYNLNYPIGSHNPRNPFFHWMIVFVSEITAPIFGSASTAAYYSFMEFDAVFGALLIIPVYLLGKSILGKKAGMLGAILYTLMPSNLTSGILSDGRMHTPELIFAFFTIYFLERSVKYLSKERIITGSLTKVNKYYYDIIEYISQNKKGTVYALLSGASFGALALSWQGYAYILAIVAIYVVVQLLVNLFLGRNNGYLLYVSTIFVVLSFSMAAYYYYAADNTPSLWFIPPLMIGVVMILISALISIFGRKPWIISVPALIVSVSAVLLATYFLTPHIFDEIISGEGYFIKNRVYSTIAEAQAPALGQYIGGFGVAQFILGIGGFGYVIYRFLRERTDSLLLLIIFSGVSIYMSFTAGRFNITAAPSYAIMGGALIYYFASILKVDSISTNPSRKSFRKASGLKGNIKWLQVLFVFLLVFALLIPSGLGVVSTAVPANSANQINKEVYSALPSFAKPPTFEANTSAYFGTTGSFITNSSTPLSQSFAWFATQQSNLPISQKPAYVDWWDYGFQELYQGKHPTVADDFQQAYQIAGQILLSTNQSQIISLMAARLIQASFINNSGHYTPQLKAALSQYLSNQELNLIQQIYENPHQFVPWILDNSSVYGNYIPGISNQNAYYVLVKGQLASKLPLSQIVNLYQSVQRATGWSIQYIQTDHNLFPLSGLDTGIFYAPAYLTDTPSYTTQSGGVVPYEYYQIYAVTSNGTFPLNQTPDNVIPTNYQITYTPAFYNTTIYRALIGLPPTAVGQTSGVPGLTFGTNQYQIQPAWNMSNFEVCYEGVPYNPFNNASAHQNAFKIIPLQQAYHLEQIHRGTSIIFPSAFSIIQGSDPILRYFPGAIITGQIKSPTGIPISGIRVTILDQYGIPHQTVLSNKYGYYNLTGLPGNDTLVFSDGTLNQRTLYGSNILKAFSLNISRQQAERKTINVNLTTGLPQYYIVENYIIKNITSTGSVQIERQLGIGSHNYNSTKILSGTVQLQRVSNGQEYNFTINNGFYNASNIGPGNYTVNVITSNGTVYRNIQNNVLTPGAPLVYNVKIPLNLIQVSVSLNKLPVKNAQIIIGSKTYYTNSTGKALVYVNVGNYSLYARDGSSVSQVNNIQFTSLGQNKSVNLSLIPGSYVNINVKNYLGNNLTLYPDGDMSSPVNLAWNGQSYSGIVTDGYYTIYDANRTSGVFYHINVYENTTMSIIASKDMSIVRVMPYGINLTAFTGKISIISGNTTLYTSFQGQGNLSFILPAGKTYDFYIQGVKVGVNYYSSSEYQLNGNQSVVLVLNRGTAFTTGVYNPDVAGVFTSTSAVNNGVVILRETGEVFGASPISSSGEATFIVNQNYTSMQAIGYSMGFSTGLRNVDVNSHISLNTVSENVSVRFISVNGGGLLDGYLNLISSRSYKENIVNGYANFSLPVGTYYLNVSGGNQYVSINQSLITVDTSHRNLTISFFSKIRLSVVNSDMANIYSLQNGTFIQNLDSNPIVLPGSYILYAANSSGLANITVISVNLNGTILPNYATSYILNLSNSLSLNNLNVKIGFSGLSFITNMTNLFLPSGHYVLSYNQEILNSTGEYVVYSANESLYLDQNTFENIKVYSKEFKTPITGITALDNLPEGPTSVAVYENNRMIAETNTTGSSSFSFNLQNGTYTLYSFNSAKMLANITEITVNPFESNLNIRVNLLQSYNTYIYTSIGKTMFKNTVNITSNVGSFSVLSNGLPVILPSHNYDFQSYVSSSFNVSNITFYQEFSGSLNKYVNGTSVVQIVLAKQTIGNLNITQHLTPQFNETSGRSVIVNFTLTNMLNTPANLTLSSGSADWKIMFNKSVIKNLPITGKVNISANITNRYLVEGGVENIPLSVSYNGISTTLYLKLNVSKFYGVNLTVKDPILGFNNGNGTYTLLFKNTGNVNETVNFSALKTSIIQGSTVNLSLLHVNASFLSPQGVRVNSINLTFNQTGKVYIYLTPQKGFDQALFKYFDIYYGIRNDTSAHHISTIYVEYPNISSLYNYIHGPGIIANYTGNPFATVEYGTILLVLVVVIGLIGVAIKGRKVK